MTGPTVAWWASLENAPNDRIITIIDFCHSQAQIPHPCTLEFHTISGTMHKCLKTPKRMVGPGDSMLLS